MVLTSRWVKDLTEDQFEQLLRTIAGETFERGAAAVEMLSLWIELDKPLQGRLAGFAWQCLERDPPVRSSDDEWNFDQLAA